MMPSHPCSASCRQNPSVTASAVAIRSRTKRLSHSPSRNLRAVSRNNSCSSLNPISIYPVASADLGRRSAPSGMRGGVDDQPILHWFGQPLDVTECVAFERTQIAIAHEQREADQIGGRG